FPALLNQPFLRLPLIFHETVAVLVPVTINPGNCLFNVGPQGTNELDIPAAFEVRTCQYDDRGSPLDAAVVTAEGDLSQSRHLSTPRLMNNLPRVGLRRRIMLVRLRGSKIFQDSTCNVWLQPQAFKLGDNSITAENRAEPRNTGI